MPVTCRCRRASTASAGRDQPQDTPASTRRRPSETSPARKRRSSPKVSSPVAYSKKPTRRTSGPRPKSTKLSVDGCPDAIPWTVTVPPGATAHRLHQHLPADSVKRPDRTVRRLPRSSHPRCQWCPRSPDGIPGSRIFSIAASQCLGLWLPSMTVPRVGAIVACIEGPTTPRRWGVMAAMRRRWRRRG